MPWSNQQVRVTYDLLVSQSGTGPINLSDLSGYNTLVIVTTMHNTNFATNTYGSIQVTAFHTVNNTPVMSDKYTLYLQGTFLNASGNINGGDTTRTEYPLNGADSVTIQPALANGSTGPVSVSVFGTNDILPYRHGSIFQPPNNDSTLMFAQARAQSTSGSQLPIPITSDPVRVYFHLDTTGTSISDLRARIIDSVTTVQLCSFDVLGGTNIGQWQYYTGSSSAPVASEQNVSDPYLSLPHTLNPMTLVTDSFTGSAAVDIFIQKGAIG